MASHQVLIGLPLLFEPLGSQVDWAQGNLDDREDPNEDGGDILDEPHGDAREDHEDGGDAEESMGWSNPMGWRIGDPAPEDMYGPGGD